MQAQPVLGLEHSAQLIWALVCQVAAVDRGRLAAGWGCSTPASGRVVGRVAFSLMMRAWPWLLRTLVSLAGVRCLGAGVAVGAAHS